jgi:general L-amino acid transport system permease protein
MSDTHAGTVAYVRDTMLPEAPPPISQVGAVRWVRENLFNGVLSTILTILSVLAVVWLVAEIGPWLSRSVWNAGSLTECRRIWAEAGVPAGACWGVINDRLNQLLFGFYPPHLYWRPVLALVLLLVALGPILFPWAPRQMLWFSMAYPFLGYFLLWGGSVWTPVSAAMGFVAGYLALRSLVRFGAIVQAGGAVAAAFIWWMFLSGIFSSTMMGILPLGHEFVRSDRFGGFLISLTIGVTGITLSLPLGVVLALGRQSDMLLIKSVSVVFIEFIRGVPLITLLFTASLLLNYFLPPGTTFDLILRVIIMVTLFAAAYMAEVIRGGLAALPRGQYEAADALGLDYWKAQRLIIMPQALKISIPGIVNTFIGLFKDTTLVVFIGLLDPIGLSNAIRASSDWQGIYWELFIFIGAVFFIFCFGMSRYSMYLERRLRTDHR